MDELEFRRRLYAEPNSQDPQVQAAAKETAGREAFWQELKGLDQKIQQAARIPVPDDLADRLLLQQNLTVHQQHKRRHRWQLAAAASVAFTVGLSFAIYNTPHDDLGQHALAHMVHEEGFVATIDEQISLASLNTKLASMGTTLQQLPGEIFYANYCDFRGVRSLHVVMGSAQGRVTLFLIPKQGELTLPAQFASERYQGVGQDLPAMHLALVGTPEQELQPVLDDLSSGFQSL
ncbi:DUF3379 domain-containing protein [Ferrimonas pelagia]|uniref:DUF3379 domain-containing protein n=1 Tax=Ferrimonas pelagia TaxID=1177826 RepID=A0ABP9E988_9GAMM